MPQLLDRYAEQRVLTILRNRGLSPDRYAELVFALVTDLSEALDQIKAGGNEPRVVTVAGWAIMPYVSREILAHIQSLLEDLAGSGLAASEEVGEAIGRFRNKILTTLGEDFVPPEDEDIPPASKP